MMGGMVEAREEDRSRNFEFVESQSWQVWLGKFLRASSLRGEGTDEKTIHLSRDNLSGGRVGFAESKRFSRREKHEGSYFPPAWIYNSCIITKR